MARDFDQIRRSAAPDRIEGSIGKGVGVALGMNFALIACAGILTGLPGFDLLNKAGTGLLAAIGLSQLVWAIPMAWRYRKRGEVDTAKGMLLTAAITLGFNTIGWIFVLTVFGIEGFS
jgi:hypothetical protein